MLWIESSRSDAFTWKRINLQTMFFCVSQATEEDYYIWVWSEEEASGLQNAYLYSPWMMRMRGIASRNQDPEKNPLCGSALNRHGLWTTYDKATIIILCLKCRSVTSNTQTLEKFFSSHSVINTILLRLIRCVHRWERSYHSNLLTEQVVQPVFVWMAGREPVEVALVEILT